MKKLFCAIAISVLLIASAAFAEVNQPQLPVKLESFVFYDSLKFECGMLDTFIYEEADGATWFAMYLNREQNPKPLLVEWFGANNSWLNWLDRNRDGIFDEESKEAFEKKYPTPCDAVK